MSTDTSAKPGTSTRVRSGGGVRRERQEERGEEENVENEGADSLRDHGSGSQGVTGDQAVQRELILQRELNLQRELTIQMNIVRACAVVLTLLFAIFVTRTVDMVMDYNSTKELLSNLTHERNHFQTRYDNMTLERNHWQTSHDNLALKITQLERELNQFKTETAVKSCPSGWQAFGCSCYYRSTEKKTWEESRAQCVETAGADLVIINSKGEQEFIRGLYHVGEESWIGLKSTGGKWAWLDGTTLTARNWASEQPVDFKDWNCAEYRHREGQWANELCSQEKNNWVCEK